MLLESLLLMALAALGIYEGARLAKVVLLFEDPVGPGWYLFIVSSLLFVCAIIYLARKFRGRAGAGMKSFSLHSGPAGQSLLLLLLYGVATLLVGYVIASAFFFILVQRIFGERSWARSAAIGLAITGAFYFGFSYLAGVPLP
jgi:hypothetical protein